MSPRIDADREHIVIQSIGITILLDRDQLRHADQRTITQLLEELSEISFNIWQTEIAGSSPADDRLDVTATKKGERA